VGAGSSRVVEPVRLRPGTRAGHQPSGGGDNIGRTSSGSSAGHDGTEASAPLGYDKAQFGLVVGTAYHVVSMVIPSESTWIESWAGSFDPHGTYVIATPVAVSFIDNDGVLPTHNATIPGRSVTVAPTNCASSSGGDRHRRRRPRCGPRDSEASRRRRLGSHGRSSRSPRCPSSPAQW
jgi:hypothetical protein